MTKYAEPRFERRLKKRRALEEARKLRILRCNSAPTPKERRRQAQMTLESKMKAAFTR